jgi:chromosomal replication initiator protein
MKVSPDARWDSALALIRKNVTEQIYNTWFKSIVFEQYDEAQKMILVQVPSPFVYEYLEEKFVDLLGKVLYHCFGKGIRLSYRVVSDKEHNLSQDIEAEPADAIDKVKPRLRANQSPTILDAAPAPAARPPAESYLTFGILY